MKNDNNEYNAIGFAYVATTYILCFVCSPAMLHTPYVESSDKTEIQPL